MAQGQKKGFKYDWANGYLQIYSDDTEIARMDQYGDLRLITGRLIEQMTATDVDAQNNTITVAQIAGGVVVHTSATGAGTATTDTAVNIIAGSSGIGALTKNGQCIKCYYINDGDQTVTLAGGTDVTISDTGQTIAANEAALLVFMRASATTVTCYVLGA